jgi:hypothetical protein
LGFVDDDKEAAALARIIGQKCQTIVLKDSKVLFI